MCQPREGNQNWPCKQILNCIFDTKHQYIVYQNSMWTRFTNETANKAQRAEKVKHLYDLYENELDKKAHMNWTCLSVFMCVCDEWNTDLCCCCKGRLLCWKFEIDLNVTKQKKCRFCVCVWNPPPPHPNSIRNIWFVITKIPLVDLNEQLECVLIWSNNESERKREKEGGERKRQINTRDWSKQYITDMKQREEKKLIEMIDKRKKKTNTNYLRNVNEIV